MARNPNMHQSDIQWPSRLWRLVRIAAFDEGITASEWVRRAARERLRTQGQDADEDAHAGK